MDIRPTEVNVARFQGILLARRTAELLRVDESALTDRESPEATERPREVQDIGDNSLYETAEDERLGAAQRSTERVRRIDAALSRITDGSYGTCLGCGETLDERRLASIPEAELCTDCQELKEERQRSGSPGTI